MMKTKSLYLALIAALLSPMAANATLITITGQGEYDGTYDVLTFTGTAADNEALLTSSPWYGDQALALAFAEAWSAQIGTYPNAFSNNSNTPYFVDALSAETVSINFYFVCNVQLCVDFNGGPGPFPSTNANFPTTLPRVFAYVAVPEPGTLALLSLGLIGMAARRRETV